MRQVLKVPQAAVVTLIGILGLPARVRIYWPAIIGFASTAAVLISILSMQTGFVRVMMSGGRADTAIITAAVAKTELTSILTNSDVAIIRDIVSSMLPEILSSVEVLTTLSFDDGLANNANRNISLRGVGRDSFSIHQQVHVTTGRTFRPGTNEIIVGSRLSSQIEGLEVGGSVKLGNAIWNIVGIFESAGDFHESEIWSDSKALQAILGRSNVFQSIRLLIPSEDIFASLSGAIGKDARIDLRIQREREFYAEQSGPMSRFIGVIGRFIALLMGAGAVVSVVNAMSGAVLERMGEFVVLRVVGFGRLAIFFSIIIEAVVLAAIGSIFGASVAFLAINGMPASTLAFGMTSQLYFSMNVTPDNVSSGVAFTLWLGIVGALLPAMQIIRAPLSYREDG